jgi:bifunctional non-homologous end joining protein LigD
MPVKRAQKNKHDQKGNRFVVHEHFASHHHFDLRLEMDGVLRSWAVPKEMPVTHGQKRLAVEVDDHPVEYAAFEGTIPEGSYGAGKVVIWDSGTYLLQRRDERRIEFTLEGHRLKGTYVLLLFRKEQRNNWLVFLKHETS